MKKPVFRIHKLDGSPALISCAQVAPYQAVPGFSMRGCHCTTFAGVDYYDASDVERAFAEMEAAE